MIEQAFNALLKMVSKEKDGVYYEDMLLYLFETTPLDDEVVEGLVDDAITLGYVEEVDGQIGVYKLC